MTVGQAIRALRKKRGLTQTQLGALCGISGGTILISTIFLQHPCPLRRAGVPSFIRHAVPAARGGGTENGNLDYDTRKGHPAMPKKQLVIIRPANGLPGITGKQPAS